MVSVIYMINGTECFGSVAVKTSLSTRIYIISSL